ncbi:efflux transporter outer membrane subunit [Tistrella mobilis]
MTPLRISLALLVAAALTGCGTLLETPYDRPALQLPVGWQQSSTADRAVAKTVDAASVRADAWWAVFGEPELDRLIDRAFARNNDLAAAAIAVRRAQLQAGLAEDDTLPQFGSSTQASRERELADDTSGTSYSTNLTVSWELDLWGRLGRTLDAARFEAAATEQDRQATALSLAATTAELYWTHVYLTQRLALADASLDYARRIADIVEVRWRAGAVSDLDRFQARQNVESQEAARLLILQSQVENDNALSILFDAPPQPVDLARERLPDGMLPAIPAGLPAGVLARRPDIRAAELRLRANLADIDATRASYLPTFSLTGSLGGSSVALRDLLANPVATLGLGLTLPFLNWTERDLTIRTSEADYEAAVVNFRQTLYQAFADTENALSARSRRAERDLRLQAALDAARSAEQIYETRYRAGAIDLQSWLESQETRRTAELNLLENRLEEIRAMITLYQALGGSSSPY